MLEWLSDNEEAERRLRDISDTIVALRECLPIYPSNQNMIDELDKERKRIMSEYIRVIPNDQECQATFPEHCQYPRCDCDR